MNLLLATIIQRMNEIVLCEYDRNSSVTDGRKFGCSTYYTKTCSGKIKSSLCTCKCQKSTICTNITSQQAGLNRYHDIFLVFVLWIIQIIFSSDRIKLNYILFFSDTCKLSWLKFNPKNTQCD